MTAKFRSPVLMPGLLLLAVLVPSAVAQATPVGLTVAQEMQLRSVANPQLGDDFVAFQLVVPRPLADGPGSAYLHLGVIDDLAAAARGEPVQPRWLVDGKGRAPGLQVRPHAREVSYLRAVDGRGQVVVQSIDGGEPSRFAATPAVLDHRWRPDGQAIAFTALDPLPPARAAARQRGIAPVVVDEDWQHVSLWVVEAGGEPRRLTSDTTVFGFEWAPDGSRIAAACAPRNLVDDSYMFTRLCVVDVATGERRQVVDNPGKLGPFAWSQRGHLLAYVTAGDRNDPHAGNLATVNLASGEVDVRIAPFSVENVHVHRGSLLATVALGVRSAWLVFEGEAGANADLPKVPDRTAIAGTVLRGQYLACVGSTATHPGELFVARLGGDDGTEPVAVRVTDSNPELGAVALGEQTVEKLRTRDGLQIEGLLIKPVGYEAGRKYPLVIVAHGGPEAHFSDGWLTSYSNWGQLLAARGYVSWYPNYRSSTGYGTAFCKHDHGDPMGKEFLDHLDAIEHFAAQGLIDKARVGIGGGSYGGYTAAWAATKGSAHFAAAVSFVPFVHIPTKWMTSDIPWEFYYVHYQEQWPWQQPGLLTDRSPLQWAHDCRTPLLLLGGTEDTRVHPSQPFMLYRAVKFATDTPVRYVQYPGEGHGNRTNVYRCDYAVRALQWFDHYLQGDGDRRRAPLPPLDLEYPR